MGGVLVHLDGAVKSIFLRIPAFRLARAIGRPLALPASLTVSVLYACNSRCKTCHIYETKAHVLDLDEYRRIFRSLGRAPRWVTMSGGEPFLRKDLAQIALSLYEHCRPRVINFPTNGTLPDRVEAVVDEVCARASTSSIIVNLSIDEVGPRHDELRGYDGNWALAMETSARLKILKRRRKNLSFGVHTVISAMNEGRFAEVAGEVEKLDPDSYIAEVAEQRVELGTTRDQFAPSEAGLSRALSLLRGRARRTTTLVAALVAALRHEYYGVLEAWAKDGREILPCYAAITSAHIMPEGKVWACCVLGESLGELRHVEYDFRTLWYGAAARGIRARIKREKCSCPLANQAYMNILLDPQSLVRVAKHAARALPWHQFS
jgi:MoaA/NifB/PqqE/SkfB family radical SAM enzyme